MRFSPVWYPQLMTPTQALLDKLELLLQDTDFIRNLLYRLIACFNLYGIKCLIHMDACHAYSPSNIAFCFSAILLKPSRSLILRRSAACSAGFFPGVFPRSECHISILRSLEKACYINGFRRSNGAYYTTITPFVEEL